MAVVNETFFVIYEPWNREPSGVIHLFKYYYLKIYWNGLSRKLFVEQKQLRSANNSILIAVANKYK